MAVKEIGALAQVTEKKSSGKITNYSLKPYFSHYEIIYLQNKDAAKDNKDTQQYEDHYSWETA